MIIITLHRDKCIGCGYCEEVAGEYFFIETKDGKTSLRGAVDKKGFFTIKTGDSLAFDPCRRASENCPVKIIKVSKTGL